jgi:hypothetical protein
VRSFGYSGFVQARERCHVDGSYQSQGSVFEVTNHVLLPNDPFFAVELVGYTTDGLCRPIYEAITDPIDELNGVHPEKRRNK